MSKSRYIYVALLLVIVSGALSIQFIEVQSDLLGYSLASQEDQEVYEKSELNFPAKKSGEAVLILEKNDGWRSYEDFKLLSAISKKWERFPSVQKSTSIVSVAYPKQGWISISKEPFLNISKESRFEKRISKWNNYKDITEKFVSKNRKYALLFLKLKKGERITSRQKTILNQSGLLNANTQIHYLQYDTLQNEVDELVKNDTFWLALLSGLFILISFFALTRSIKGLFLVGIMILFNASGVVLFMVSFSIPFTIHSITVPCIIIVLSFTDLMHMMYYHRKLEGDAKTDAELKKEIIKRIKTPMLITSLTNVIGFVIFLILSENQLLFNFALVSIVGVSIAYLSSRYLAIQLMRKDKVFLKRFESPRLSSIHNSILTHLSRMKGLVVGAVLVLGMLLFAGVFYLFEIDGFKGSLTEKESPQLKASQLLKENFFGSKQLEIVVSSGEGDLITTGNLNQIEAIEKDIQSIFNPLYINSLPTIVKRYNRYAHNGHIGAYIVPDEIKASSKKQIDSHMDELGGAGIRSIDKLQTKITFGYHDLGLKNSRKQYAQLQKRLDDYKGSLNFEITGRHYISDVGAYEFTWKIIVGLILGVLFSSVLVFVLLKSAKESLWLLVVNFTPVLLALLTMLLMEISITPVALFFLSLLAGICVDDSVYIVTQRNKSVSKLHIFPIFVTTVVMCIGFAALGFSSFTWARPFAWVFLIGLGTAFIMDLFILPLFFNRNSNFDTDG